MKKALALCFCLGTSAAAVAAEAVPTSIGADASGRVVTAWTGQSPELVMYGYLKIGGEAIPPWLGAALSPSQGATGPVRDGGDTYADATVIPFSAGGVFTDEGSTLDATADYDYTIAPTICPCDFFPPSMFDGRDVVYTFTLPVGYTVSASTCNAAVFDTCLGIVDSAGHLVAANDDSDQCEIYTSLIQDCCLPAGTYYIVVDSYTNYMAGDYTLTVSFGAEPCMGTDPCADFDARLRSIALPYHGMGSTVGAPNVVGGGSGDVGLQFSLTEASAVSVTTCLPRTNHDTDSYLYEGSPCHDGTQIMFNDGPADCDVAPYATSWTAECGILEAGDYTLVLTGHDEAEGLFEISVTAAPCSCPPLVCSGTPEVEPNDGPGNNPASFGEIHCGEAVCGTVFTSWSSDGYHRDSDWHQVLLEEASRMHVELAVEAFNGVIHLADSTATVFATWDAAALCQPENIETNCLDAGRYYLIVTPDQMVGLEIPVSYELTLGCEPCGPLAPYTACQEIHTPAEEWTFGISESVWPGGGISRRERFATSGLIQTVDFTGGSLFLDSFWQPCDEDPMPFTISFLTVDQDLVQSYQVELAGLTTGAVYGGLVFTREYTFELPAPLALAEGWLEIQGGGSDTCWFLWGSSDGADGSSIQLENGTPPVQPFDLNYCLTTIEIPVDAIDSPTMFELTEPYPNPFNPTTTLGFSLPYTQRIQLLIHDLAGRQVAVLQEGLAERGEHRVVFDGAGMASGLYLCTLKAESGTRTQKLVLAK